LDINGTPVPASSLLALIDGDSGGGASADEPSSSRLSGFISGGSIRSEQTETSTLAGFHAQTYNVTAGMDYRFTDKVFAGAAARYSSSEVDLHDDDGSMDAEDGNLTLYGTYYPGQNWYMDGTMHYGQNQFDLTRRINFSIGGTPFDETAKSDTEGNQYGLSVGSGYEWYSGDGAVSLMTANLRYNKANIDEYTEKSGGGFNLNIHEQSFDSLILKLGGQISKAYSQSWGVILPQVNINYFHEFIEDGEQITASFVSDDTNTQFAFTTEERDNNYFSLAAGVVVVLPGGFTAYGQGEVYKAIENYKQSIWSLGARWEF
ncbi:autotransporter outer membrane beta-barrel domain-containing protein, partial [Kaarinaea lacus]